MATAFGGLLHPDYSTSVNDWEKWRLTYQGGQEFIERYLYQLSAREDTEDFKERKKVTYCPAFAKSGVNEIKDSIYQRMYEITRAGGTTMYQEAIDGLNGGVDLEGSSMNYFMGCKILPELLTMKRVGIYVDMPELSGESLADNIGKRPYIYMYRTEDIINWVKDEESEDPNDYAAVLLRDYIYEYDEETGFPKGRATRYRRLWRDADGIIMACFHNESGQMVDKYGVACDEAIPLSINRLPFVVAEISESLLIDVADYQISLLNLASADMSYALKANFPFYVEQAETRATGNHLKPPSGGTYPGEEGQAEPAKQAEVKVGTTKGRRYGKGMEAPSFIHPSPEPLQVSMEKQEQLKADIRVLLNLTLSSLQGPKMASAASKEQDRTGLESGLSYIGLTLENTERKIGDIWSSYEGTTTTPTIKYPINYSLRTEADRDAEAGSLEDSMSKIPSLTYQKHLCKRIVNIRLGQKISREELKKIETEIDNAVVIDVNPEVVAKDLEVGILGLELASKLRGYPTGEVERAKIDHADRLARIAEAQSTDNGSNQAARGVPDASPNPKQDASSEKAASRDTTKDATVGRRVRGKGRRR